MTTIGLLHAGDMGATFGGGCARAGLRVVTTIEGRSAATATRAAAFEVLSSLVELVAVSDCVIDSPPNISPSRRARARNCTSIEPRRG